MYRCNIHCLLTGVVCFLVTILLYTVVSGVTLPAVCVALAIIALIIAYSYWNDNGIHVQISPHLGPPPADGYSVDSHSASTNVVDSWRSTHSPGAPVTSALSRCYDRSPSSTVMGQSRLRYHTKGTNDRTGLVSNEQSHSPRAITDYEALPSRHIRSQASDQNIPVQTTKGEHSNKTFSKEITANEYLGYDTQLQSAVEARGYRPNSSSLSSNPQLPTSGCKDTTPELFPYSGQITSPNVNETVRQPTCQLQYGSLGILPLVHLSETPPPHTTSYVYGNRSLGHGSVGVRIAPPDPLLAPVQFMQPDYTPLSSQISTSSVSDVLTQKRKSNTQLDEVLESGRVFQPQSYKRRKLEERIKSASSSSLPTVGVGGSGVMNLKRPPLKDIDAEMSAPKQRCLQPSPVPSASQRGASARNPVDASYTSSKRWLSRMVAPGIYQDSSQSSLVETEPRSTISNRSRMSEIVQKRFSGGQMRRSNEGEEHFLNSPPLLQSSGLRNSSSYASPDKVQPDKNSRNNSDLSNCMTNKDLPPCNADASMLSQGTSEVCHVESTSYKVHLTYEDVEGDRRKETERAKYMLGEGSDLIQDTEVGLPSQCAVSSSTPLSPSLPRVATSGLQSASEPLVVSDSVSPVAAAHLSTFPVSPSVQQHMSSGTAVVYSTPSVSQAENAQQALRYDLTSSLGSSLGQFPVSFTANPNPPASLNSTSAASSVILTAPPITTIASPLFSTGFTLATDPMGGFKFPSNKTSLSGFTPSPSSVSNTVGGFKFVPSNKSTTSTACSLQFPQYVTTVSASTNSAAVFSFGQTTGEQAPSFSQPRAAEVASTSVTSPTNADSSVVKAAAFVSADRGTLQPTSSTETSQAALKFGALPAFGTFVANQPLHTISFGSQQAVTNSFSTQPTTAIAFNNQFMNPVVSTPIASESSHSNSKASLFATSSAVANFPSNSEASASSFNNPTSTVSISSPAYFNFPSNSDASVLSFTNPTSTVGISKSSLPAFSFNNQTSINSISTSLTSFSNSGSLNSFGNQPKAGGPSANQVNHSVSGFGGLSSHSDVFGNQQLTSSNSYGQQQTVTFSFGTPTTTLGNVFDSQTESSLSFEKSSTDANIFGNHVGDRATQTGGFGSYAGLSAPTCLVEQHKALFSNPQFTQAQPQFTQAQFSFPQVPSGNLNNSSTLSPGFQFPHNAETTSIVTSAQPLQPPTAPNPFSSDIGFSQFQNNSPTMSVGQFLTQPNQLSTAAQSPFASQAQWMPRFSIGTDSSSAAKNRPVTKSRTRRKP